MLTRHAGLVAFVTVLIRSVTSKWGEQFQIIDELYQFDDIMYVNHFEVVPPICQHELVGKIMLMDHIELK